MHTTETLLAAITVPGGRAIPDPATGDVIGHVRDNTVAELEAAVEWAKEAQPAWAALTDEQRVEKLLAVADAIDESAEALARILSLEQGKPMGGFGARAEVAGCAAWFRATASMPVPHEVLSEGEDGNTALHYRPIGVVGAITPWNFPMMIAVWQIAPSIRMGNTVVAKPSEYTTLSGLALIEVIRAVLPDGVVEVVVGAGEIGDALVRNPIIGKVMFTGSTNTGSKIISASAGNITRLTLELGGNDAGIVLADADPQVVANGVFWGAFANSGQVCAALKRLYVHEDIYEGVVDALVAIASTVQVGSGADESSILGPVQNRMQWRIVDDLVEEAKEQGARIATGGNPDREAAGNFYPLTLVADIDNDASLVQYEQFGPALPIVKYRDVEDAIEWANGVDVGLGGSVWSSDRDAARQIATRLEAGTVWVNQHGSINPFVPFGGTKRSGYGLEFGAEGLKAVSVPQVVHS